MARRTYSKLRIASQQLDTALRLYFEGEEFFSVVTLAGAAEEVLGVYLKAHSQPNAFDEGLDSSMRLYEWIWKSEGSRERMHKVINRVKNGAKHMMGKNDVGLYCDPKAEARKVLDRAVSNYYALMDFEKLEETSRMRKFNVHLTKRSA